MRKTLASFLILFLLVATFIVWSPTAVYATTLFSDGFESGNFSSWTGSTANAGDSVVANDTTQIHHGSYNMKARLAASHTNEYAEANFLITGNTTVYMRAMKCVFSAAPPTSGDQRTFSFTGAATADAVAYFGIQNNAGDCRWYCRARSSGSTLTDYYGTNMVIGTAYNIECAVFYSGSAGWVTMWVDGSVVINQTGLDNDYTVFNYAVLGFLFSDSNATATFCADCVVIATSYIGPESTTGPSFGSIDSANGTYYFPSYGFNMSCVITDADGISGSITSNNSTGLWVNASWSTASSATSKTVYMTGTHNSTKYNVESFKVYANGTLNNWESSTQYNFTLTDQIAAWQTYAELIAHFDFLVFQNSSAASKTLLQNTSVDGISLYVYKFGINTTRIVLFDGGIHGLEYYNCHALLWTAQWLMNGTAAALDVLAHEQVCIVPSINPDQYTEARKNAAGVDLNRNFVLGWELGVSDPESEEYRGPSAASEPETQAMRALFTAIEPDVYVSLHDNGGPYISLRPYGSTAYKSSCVSLLTYYNASVGTKGIGNAHNYSYGTAVGHSYDDAYTIPSNESCLVFLWEITSSGAESPYTIANLRDNKTIHLESFLEGAVVYFNSFGGGGTALSLSGLIPLTFSLSDLNRWAFNRQSVITMTCTLSDWHTLAQNIYSSLTATFSSLSEKAVEFSKSSSITATFNIQGLKSVSFLRESIITLTTSIDGMMSYISGTFLNLFGIIPVSFTSNSIQTWIFSIFPSIPITLTPSGTPTFPTIEEQHGGFLQWLISFIAFNLAEGRQPCMNANVIIYEMPANHKLLDLTTDANGKVNATLPQGEYKYIATYQNQTIQGTFVQTGEATVQLEFNIAAPVPVTKIAVGALIIGIGGIVIYNLNKQVKKKRKMRKPNLKPKWKHPRPESEGYA